MSSSRAMWIADWITRTRASFWEFTPVPTICTVLPPIGARLRSHRNEVVQVLGACPCTSPRQKAPGGHGPWGPRSSGSRRPMAQNGVWGGRPPPRCCGCQCTPSLPSRTAILRWLRMSKRIAAIWVIRVGSAATTWMPPCLRSSRWHSSDLRKSLEPTLSTRSRQCTPLARGAAPAHPQPRARRRHPGRCRRAGGHAPRAPVDVRGPEPRRNRCAAGEQRQPVAIARQRVASRGARGVRWPRCSDGIIDASDSSRGVSPGFWSAGADVCLDLPVPAFAGGFPCAPLRPRGRARFRQRAPWTMTRGSTPSTTFCRGSRAKEDIDHEERAWRLSTHRPKRRAPKCFLDILFRTCERVPPRARAPARGRNPPGTGRYPLAWRHDHDVRPRRPRGHDPGSTRPGGAHR